MAVRNLTEKKEADPEKKGTRLTNNEKSFKFALTGSLFSNFEFKDLKTETVKTFHKFIDEILSKKMTITQVENTLLRTKGSPPYESCDYNGRGRKIYHLGKKRDSFRIHGYYNDEFYFVICRIDPNHKVHKG